MTGSRIRIWTIVFALTFTAWLPASAQDGTAPDGAKTLEAVQATYDRLESLRAAFTQTVESDFSSGSTQIEGTLLLKDTKYRVETDDQTLVTDGTTTWVYSPADSQVVINTASQDPSALSPETFFTDYARRYTVESARSERRNSVAHTVLELAPSARTTTFEAVTLWVRDSDTIVTRLRVRDRNGSTITIDLDDVELNPSIPDTEFRFEPPADVDVVDLRSE